MPVSWERSFATESTREDIRLIENKSEEIATKVNEGSDKKDHSSGTLTGVPDGQKTSRLEDDCLPSSELWKIKQKCRPKITIII